MAVPDAPIALSRADAVEKLSELIEMAHRGELDAFSLRYQTADGEWHDLAAGFKSEAERDAALAQLRRLLGQLH